jgi:hypothetical protein
MFSAKRRLRRAKPIAEEAFRTEGEDWPTEADVRFTFMIGYGIITESVLTTDFRHHWRADPPRIAALESYLHY